MECKECEIMSNRIEELETELDELEEKIEGIATDYYELTGEPLIEAICRMQDEAEAKES